MLYLIKSGNYLKIGSAQNIEQRMKTYKTHNPDFQLLATREGNKNEETQLHKLFKDKKHYGEWFDYSEEIINTFNNYVFENKTIHNELSITKANSNDYISREEYIKDYNKLQKIINILIDHNTELINIIKNYIIK